jgi:hypothetical protein
MRRFGKTRTIAAVFGALATLALGGCGSSDDDIPKRSADEMLGLIEEIRTAVNDGRCDDAAADTSTLSVTITGLDQGDVPDDVITAIDAGAVRLASLVETECGAEETTTTTTETTTAEETTTTTTDEDTTTTTDEGTTTETTTDTTTTPGDGGSGGTGAGGTEAPGGSGATPRVPGLPGPGGED